MFRERQIAATARGVKILARLPFGRKALRYCQGVWPMRPLYRALHGYRRPFMNLTEAQAAVASYARQGHENTRNVESHFELSAHARPSDYAAFFYFQPLISEMHTVFDLGGNAGNLFYCYREYLEWPSDLTWIVKDLPKNMEAGESVARERGVTALQFSDDWQRASTADLLIVSGSLHHMEKPLSQMIEELSKQPRFLLVNRTPLTEGKPVAAIQDAGDFRVACMLYNRLDFIRSLEALGYVMLDQWQAAELSLEVPGYPEDRIRAYTGIFFEKRPTSD